MVMKMNIIRYSLFVTALAFTAVANAQQTDRDCIRQGNRYFRAGEMDKAAHASNSPRNQATGRTICRK